MELILGIITGFVFGFLLQKAQVLRFERQVGFLLLKDMTIIKFMLSAVIVGMIGLHLFAGVGVIAFKLKATHVYAQLMGGMLFGIGWAIAGYCPGTAVGACAEGRAHAMWVVLGMLVGAAVYAEIYPHLKGTLLSWANLGKVTLPGVLHVNQWALIAIFTAGILLLFRWLEKRNL